MDEKKAIGKRFKDFLKLIGMSNKDFAAYVNEKYPNVISTYFSGVNPIHKVAPYLPNLGCSLDWLYTGEGCGLIADKFFVKYARYKPFI